MWQVWGMVTTLIWLKLKRVSCYDAGKEGGESNDVNLGGPSEGYRFYLIMSRCAL